MPSTRNRHLLLERLAPHVRDRAVLNLIGQYLRRVTERGGVVEAYRRGLPLGGPLSPVLGAFFLGDLDEALAQGEWFHVRFMDDVLVLAPTCWKLRRAVRVVNEVLAALGLRKHPANTFIGRVEKGFDWLGYRLAPDGLHLAARTVDNFVARMTGLYEHTSGRSDSLCRWDATQPVRPGGDDAPAISAGGSVPVCTTHGLQALPGSDGGP